MTRGKSGRQSVVIIGGGFGGLYCARELRSADVDVTLIDRRNFHLFQPLLYQVATGGLSPGDIASPLREVLKTQKNAQVRLAEATGFDLEAKEVILRNGRLRYDVLVVAAGAETSYFGNDEWARHSPGLKSLEDATTMRRRILLAFEEAENERDPRRREALLTFVVVGGGPTGVELAGAVAELARDTLRRDFRRIDPTESHILLIEGADRVLPSFDGKLSLRAAADLRNLGVQVQTNSLVRNVEEDLVVVQRGDVEETIPCRTVLWAAGVRASPLAEALAQASGARLDESGRIPVTRELTLEGRPEIFVIGDMARAESKAGTPLPGVAPVAMQQGSYVARAIRDRLNGETTEPFRYVDRGNLATIGRALAVAQIGRFRFGGFLAWLAWLLVHIVYLIGFENRLLVLIQWAWNYVTWNRSARLITDPPSPGSPTRRAKRTIRDSETETRSTSRNACSTSLEE